MFTCILSHYDDMVDESNYPEESLYDFGVIRNSHTGETLIYNSDLEDTFEKIINIEDIEYALDNVDTSFKDYEICKKDECFWQNLTNEKLSEAIMIINNHTGVFSK